MVWDKPEILRTLRTLHKAKADLSYNALARKKQSLVSAAAYHFGSYRAAVEKAGIAYADQLRRPRWSKPIIIGLIKAARRKGEDLHWSAVTKRRDELGKAAFASLQRRLFGSWDRALHGAGLDADEINRYRKWTKQTIVFELRSRSKDRDAVNSGALQKEDAGLYAAAMRHFKSYDAALAAARIDPAAVRQRRRWSKGEVLRSIKARKKAKQPVSDSSVRKEDAALYGASVRLFGNYSAARTAAGISLKK